MTRMQWTILGALFVAVLLLFCVLGVLAMQSAAPLTQNVVFVEVTPIASSTPRPTTTPLPTTTPDILDLSLVQIQNCCKAMTQIQETQYLSTLVGRRIHWQGTVTDARTDGTIQADISGTFVEIKGTPPNIAAKIQKGQFIDFLAIITKADDAFLEPGVELRFESLR